jgi:hypothetical protein
MLGAIYYNEGTSIDVYMVVINYHYQEVDTHSVHQCSLFSATIIYRGRENRGDVRSETESDGDLTHGSGESQLQRRRFLR